jgi:hypothetical protein
MLIPSDNNNLTLPAAEAIKQDFFAKMASALDLSVSSINTSASWLADGLNGTATIPLADYMYNVYPDLNAVQGWDEIGAPLAELYAAYNDGAYMPTNPMVNMSFAYGQNATARARYPESQARREAFKDWWDEYILPTNDETCTSSIYTHSLFVPPNEAKTADSVVGLAYGYWDAAFANYAQLPEIVVPIGQIQYWSPSTLKMEWWPMSVAFAAAKGCDLVLFELVDKLREKGLIKAVLRGRSRIRFDGLELVGGRAGDGDELVQR